MDKKKRAAALSYELGEVAPRVIALGKGLIAERIIETAQENNIPVFENSGLVEALMQLEMGAQIPPELYNIVAEVLVYVSNIDRLKGGKDGYE